jgi:hypothetical protein
MQVVQGGDFACGTYKGDDGGGGGWRGKVENARSRTQTGGQRGQALRPGTAYRRRVIPTSSSRSVWVRTSFDDLAHEALTVCQPSHAHRTDRARRRHVRDVRALGRLVDSSRLALDQSSSTGGSISEAMAVPLTPLVIQIGVGVDFW